MIRSITIHNFQSHADTKVDLVPGVNVIIGTTDQGKTAILRALYWVLTNRPRGESIIRHGTKDCLVTINTENGDSVTRRRDPSFNGYLFNGEALEALGADVPMQVRQALDLTDLNIQRQFDSFFLLHSTPGAVASAINAVTHLEQAERVADLLHNKGKAQDGLAKDLTIQIQSSEEELKKYANLPQVKDRLDEADRLYRRFCELEARTDDLSELLFILRRVEKEISELPTIPDVDTDGMLERALECDRLSHSMMDLGCSYSRLMECDRILGEIRIPDVEVGDTYQGYLHQQSMKRELGLAVHDLTRLNERINAIQVKDVPDTSRWLEDKTEFKLLIDLMTELVEVDSVIVDLDEREKALMEEYTQCLSQIDCCPVCGSELNDECRTHLVENKE